MLIAGCLFACTVCSYLVPDSLKKLPESGNSANVPKCAEHIRHGDISDIAGRF